MFWGAVGIAAAFVLAGVMFTDPFKTALMSVVGQITADVGWLYLLGR